MVFDGVDGPDLAVSLGLPGNVVVLLNAGTDGGGNWLGFAGVGQTFVGNDLSGIAVGFFDADGNLDVAVTDRSSNELFVMPGNGDGVSLLGCYAMVRCRWWC